MTREELFDILRPIIITVTGVPECILADPNAPSPNGEYASVEPSQSIRQRGQANIIRTDTAPVSSPIGLVNNLNVDVRAQIIANCSINFYRGDARGRASRLFQANKRPDISVILFQNNLGWNGTEAINDLTALQSNRQEQRAQITIRLMYETTDPVVINAIYSAQIIVENENGDELSNTLVTNNPTP